MGNGMNKVLPGLFVGNFRDARDVHQLEENRITHIISIHDNAKPSLPGKVYLCIAANDIDTQDLAQYFSQTNDFIHRCRLNGGNVLVHCLAGVSRSVTITTAYVMTVTDLGWREALNAVRGSRRCANPNFGFQRQLLSFQHDRLEQERKRLQEAFAPSPHAAQDKAECMRLLEIHRDWVQHGDRGRSATSSAHNKEDDKTYPLAHNAFGNYSNQKETSRGQQLAQGQGHCGEQHSHLNPNKLVDAMFAAVGGAADDDVSGSHSCQPIMTTLSQSSQPITTALSQSSQPITTTVSQCSQPITSTLSQSSRSITTTLAQNSRAITEPKEITPTGIFQINNEITKVATPPDIISKTTIDDLFAP